MLVLNGLIFWEFAERKLEMSLNVAVFNRNCTRNSSGDEIANVNFLCDDIVHALKIQ